jgi:hypothetical protein
MNRFSLFLPVGLALCLLAVPVRAQELVDQDAVAAIRKHGLEHSRVMETLSWLTDVYGPRLTGSPELDAASQWARQHLEGLGLQNVHLEAWGPFGRGWTLNRFSLHAKSSTMQFPVLAYPKAWSPGLARPVTAEVVLLKATNDDELAQYQGKLKGKFVMIEPPRKVEEPFEPLALRRDEKNLLDLANWAGADERPSEINADRLREQQFNQRKAQFVYDEQPVALLDRTFKGDYGTVFVSSASVPAPPGAQWPNIPRPYQAGVTVIPQATLAVEHYNRIVRLLEKGFPVTLTMDLAATFTDTDPMEYNIIGEIPGTDPSLGQELVMLGAHFDSWHAGTGTTDNAAGSAVMIEAVRILQEVFRETGKQPRRTIRIALWTGEEQGLLGSRAYVDQHFATMGTRGQPPTALKPDHAKFSGYYNMDNGTGKIRGVYLQGNEAVAPIFRAWLKPFADLGASTLTLSNTGGTDHLSFDAAGLPGFQFIQEQMAYSTRTHHSNMDLWDHASEEDLKQAATIIASFVYHTAQRNDKLPRKPLPGLTQQ